MPDLPFAAALRAARERAGRPPRSDRDARGRLKGGLRFRNIDRHYATERDAMLALLAALAAPTKGE